MKNLSAVFIGFFITLFSLTSYAQEDTMKTQKIYKNELGIEITRAATFVIKDFYSYGGINNYSLFYKRHFRNQAIRFSVGGSYSERSGKENISDTVTTNSKTNSSNVRIAAGYERQLDLAKRWKTIYGLDLLFTYGSSKSIRESNSSRYNSNSSSAEVGGGVSPFFGIKFIINSRFSLATEINFDIMYSEQKSTSKNDYLTTGERNSTESRINMNVSKVIILYFNF